MKGRSNIGSGGTGNISSVLTINHPADATLTISPNIDAKIISTTQTQYTINNLNTYTITATNDTYTTSKSIPINFPGMFKTETLEFHVPNNYQEVEYLQSSGTQRIDTGIIFDSSYLTTTVHFELAFQFIGFEHQAHICGISKEISSSYNTEYEGYTEYSMFKFNVGRLANNCVSLRTPITNLYNPTILTVDNIGSNFISAINGAQFPPDIVDNFNYSGQTYPLFACRRESSSFIFSSCRISHFLIIKNNIQIIDLYPCYRKSDNVAGMWDKVSSSFLTNAGSGTFIIGNNV